MTTIEKLDALVGQCTCEVSVTFNGHTVNYETIPQYLERASEWRDLEEDIRARILTTGKLVELHFYPRTPISFFRVIDSDLDKALDRALDAVRQ